MTLVMAKGPQLQKESLGHLLTTFFSLCFMIQRKTRSPFSFSIVVQNLLAWQMWTSYALTMLSFTSSMISAYDSPMHLASIGSEKKRVTVYENRFPRLLHMECQCSRKKGHSRSHRLMENEFPACSTNHCNKFLRQGKPIGYRPLPGHPYAGDMRLKL